MIPPPDFLWRIYLQHEMRQLDVLLDVPRQYTDHFRKTSEKWIDKIIARANEVLAHADNAEVRSSSIYCATPLSHWYPVNIASRLVLTLKHFIKWARSLGTMTNRTIKNWTPVNNLLTVAVYWSLAAAMPVKARSAFSTELTVNILQLENMPDLSQSILSTDLHINTIYTTG